MKIGNIVFESEPVNHVRVEYINYYDLSTNLNTINKNLPTLYVGWSYLKKCNLGDEITGLTSILNKIIIPNKLYWEFSFSENKPEHAKGVNSFAELVPKYYFLNNYEYKSLDPIFKNINSLIEIEVMLPIKIDSMYNYKNEMLYLLNDNRIIGIDLKMFDFFKFNINEIINLVTERTIRQYDDIDGELYQKQYKIFSNFIFLKRYMVSILSK
jgi:hypothetical protein